MNLEHMDITNNSIYKEEFIKQFARLEAEEYKIKVEKEKNKKSENKKLIIYLLGTGIISVFAYYVVFLPLYNMLVR